MITHSRHNSRSLGSSSLISRSILGWAYLGGGGLSGVGLSGGGGGVSGARDWWLGPGQNGGGVGALSGEAVLSRLVARVGTKGQGGLSGGGYYLGEGAYRQYI